ncbi:MAG: hypothetical protein MJY88_09775 [Bacteroidales bacterium]|nr:hypothetical protein [Bacteroidales bacterium]
MKRYIIVIIAALSLACSCDKVKVDQDFLDSENLCLVEAGRKIHTYDPLTWQVAFNKDKKEFRVFSDTMSDYYVLTCSEVPTAVGQEIHANLKWSESSIVNRTGLTFRVEKISGDKIWLWCRKSRIEVSVMAL